jgi:hypothetical protein
MHEGLIKMQCIEAKENPGEPGLGDAREGGYQLLSIRMSEVTDRKLSGLYCLTSRALDPIAVPRIIDSEPETIESNLSIHSNPLVREVK